MFQALKSKVGGPARSEVVRTQTVPAPVGGLNTRDAEATTRPIYATAMENFWPQERFLGIRKGWTSHVTGMPAAVKHMVAWNGPTSRKLFAFTSGGTYDVTSAGAVGASLLARTEGEHVSANFNVSGGSYLFAVNSVDDLAQYNGTSWSAVPTFPLSGGGTFATNKLSFVAVHQRALFFIEENSMIFHYLAINQITGNLTPFPLGALFRRGGKLVGVGSWTVDGGIGLNDVAVFITSEGEAAVYRGTDPSGASTWTLDGVYDVGPPIGKAPFLKLGGDLLILTKLGVVSMSKVLKAGLATEKTTYTELISARYLEYIQAYGDQAGWRLHVNYNLNMLMVEVPNNTTRGRTQLAMNLITGAWTEFVGLDATAWAVMGNDFYGNFGTVIGKFWTDSDDNGTRIACLVKCAWLYLPPRARRKRLSLLRFLIRLGGKIRLSGAVDTDFKSGRAWQTIVNLDETLSRFDADEWNTATWSSLPEMRLDWLTLPCEEGHCLAPRLRVFGGDATFEWSAVDYAFTEGGVM